MGILSRARVAACVGAVSVAVAACGESHSGSSSDGGTSGTPTNAGAGGGGRGGAPAQGGAPAHGGVVGRGGDMAVAGESGSGGDTGGGSGVTGMDGGATGTDGGAAGASGADCVLFVDGNTGDDSRDGATWSTAVASVTRALELSQRGCELWITRGTYFPGTQPSSTFSVLHGETLRGGFDGTETTPDDRKPGGGWTVLSGEIGDPKSTEDNVFQVVTTSGSVFDRLEIQGGNAGDLAAPSMFNGAAIGSSGAVTLVDCQVDHNYSSRDAGGIYATGSVELRRSALLENSADHWGGALMALGDELTIIDTTFEGNTALNGGAIYTTAARITVTAAQFSKNVATPGNGGGIDAVQTSAGSLNLSGTSFDANQAGDGAALTTAGAVVIASSSFTNNTELYATGGVVSTTGDLSIDASEFRGNAGSALRHRCGGPSRKASVTGTTFARNQAPEGAAIDAAGCSLLSIESSHFSDNAATERGGAILGQMSEFELTAATFDGNTSGSDGGALYLERVDLFATGIELTSNAAASGGAVYADTCWLQIAQGLLSGNSATDTGGAVFVDGDSTEVKFTDSELSLNTATDAAALFRSTDVSQLTLNSGVVTTEFTGVTLAGNVGTGRGSVDSVASLSIVNSIVWANEPRDLELDDNDTLVLEASNVSGTAPDLSFVDPRFVDLASDRRLASDSPCIDTASDDAASAADLLGHARLDIANVPSCPSDQPDCSSVADMGAYEYGY